MFGKLGCDEFTRREGMNGRLTLINPMGKTLIKGEEKLGTNAYGGSCDMCIFLSGDRRDAFPLRSTWHRCNNKRDSKNLLVAILSA
jgi:hypothetical protein